MPKHYDNPKQKMGGGPATPTATTRRYNENDMGFDYGKVGVPESLPNQSLDSIPRGLPNESPDSLLSEANRNAKRVGSDSEM